MFDLRYKSGRYLGFIAVAMIQNLCLSACISEEEQVGMTRVSESTDSDDVRIYYGAADLRGRIQRGELKELVLVLNEPRVDALKLAYIKGVLGDEAEVDVSGFDAFPVVHVRGVAAVDLKKLERITNLVEVYENEKFYRHVSSALPFIQQDFAAQRGSIGQGVGVAVLDTGVDFTHSDFGSCASAGAAGCAVVYAEDFAPDDGEDDAHGHGSNVASIVLSTAPGADIVALDVFDDDVASSTDILSALNWVVQNKQTYNIGVVNMSLGAGQFSSSCGNTVFSAGLQSVRQAGIVAVASAGNDGYVGSMGAPACDPDVVSVGAVYDRSIGGVIYSSCADATSDADQVACFSNTTSFIDFLAPGVSVSGGGYVMSGTSQAAPFVAGAFAVIQEEYPGESVVEQIARLKRSPKVIDSRSNESFSRLDFSAVFDEGLPAGGDELQVVGTSRVAASGGDVVVNVITDDHCEWTASLSESWGVIQGAGGSVFGAGQVVVQVSENVVEQERFMDVSVGTSSVTVGQDAAVAVVEESSFAVEGDIVVNWNRVGTWFRFVPAVFFVSGVDGAVVSEVCIDVVTAGAPDSDVCVSGWKSYQWFKFVMLPAQDGAYELRIRFKSDAGEVTEDVWVEQVVLDRVAPEDGDATLVQSGSTMQLDFTSASDAGTGVSGYAVFMKFGQRAPSCFGLPGEVVVYQGEAPQQVVVDTDGRDVSFRVCAYDHAGNVSPGVIASTSDVYGID